MINLSIIIPHYNDSKRLGRMLSSIPKQEDIEVIVIDDNSSDDEKESALYLAKKYNIKFMENTENFHSPGTVRNIGIKNSKGNWLLFGDSDDYFLDNFYNVIERFFLTNNDIVYFKGNSFIEGTNIESDRNDYVNDRIDKFYDNRNRRNELYLRTIDVPWQKLYKRSFLMNNNILFSNIRYDDDIEFGIKAGVLAKEIDICLDKIYSVSSSDNSISKVRKGIKVFDERKQAQIRRFIYAYNHWNKQDLRLLKWNRYGLRFVLSPYKNGFVGIDGLKLSWKYYKQLKTAKIPLLF